MPKFKVIWEVSKFAIVNAKNEQNAIDKVNNSEAEGVENEITSGFEAYEVKK